MRAHDYEIDSLSLPVQFTPIIYRDCDTKAILAELKEQMETLKKLSGQLQDARQVSGDTLRREFDI